MESTGITQKSNIFFRKKEIRMKCRLEVLKTPVTWAHFSYKWAIKIKTVNQPAENFLSGGSSCVGK